MDVEKYNKDDSPTYRLPHELIENILDKLRHEKGFVVVNNVAINIEKVASIRHPDTVDFLIQKKRIIKMSFSKDVIGKLFDATPK